MSIGQNVRHDSSYGHVTGESIFIDDRSKLRNEVFVGIVGSRCAKGFVKSIDIEKALSVPGVLGIYSAKDFSSNIWGTIVKEQPLLVENEIRYFDEPILLIASENSAVFEKAKKQVEIIYEEKSPTLSIEDAIENNDFCYEAFPFNRGDSSTAIKDSIHKLKGDFVCGGQEHFYMENQAAVVYPLEDGQLEVHSSSQHPSETQHLVAHALGLGNHKVVSIVKRMGGGFGGKESQAAPFAAYAALVAKKLKRPARIVLTKDEDMKITGKRHPFKNFYEVGFDEKGIIQGIKFDLYADAGAYTDLTPSILERAMFHADSAYYFKNVTITAKACRTNTYSNTAFRGFGGPQGSITIESIIEDIANYLKIDPLVVRQLNLYGISQNNITPYGQIIENNMLPFLFSKIENETDYKLRREKIDKFNKENKGKVKGLSISATKFGIAFTAKFLNQGNALVNLHLDGTVQISTGATEMGQGVNTKISQIASHVLGIPTEKIKVMPTSTEKNHNTSPTAASSGTDINGAAVQSCCEKISKRLKIVAHNLFSDVPFDDVVEYEIDKELNVDFPHIILESESIINTETKEKLPITKVIQTAYLNRISLAEYSHYKTEGLGFDKKKGSGIAFKYFTQGVALSEVLIDEFTGELKILQTDIFMDLGRPLNPGIDEGQVSGAFIQGVGWVTTEKLVHSEKGELLSHSPTTYKIPSIQDIPRVFNINLIENKTNQASVYGSKAVGEPPFLLGSSVWCAVKNALSYRASHSIPSIQSPATNEEILMELTRLKNE